MIPAEIGGKIALVLGGALIGASTTFIITKRYMEKKYELQYDDIIDNMEAELRDTKAKVDEAAREGVIAGYASRIEDLGYSENEHPGFVQDIPVNFKDVLEESLQDKLDSGEAVITVNGEPWTDSSNEEEVEEETDFIEEPVRDTTKPYPVTFDEWFDANETMGSMSLTYFEADGVMIDDHEQIVFNTEDLVGEDFDKWFGWKTDGSKDTVYIRNDQTGSLYAIEREESSYRDHVLEDMSDDYEPNVMRSGVRKMRDE